MSTSLATGREMYERRAWGAASAALSAADAEQPLELDDLERLATATCLTGRDDADLWARAHQECLRLGDRARSVRCAFLLILGLFARGEAGRASGWQARVQKLMAEPPSAGGADGTGAEQGYPLVFEALEHLEDDPATGLALFTRAAELGERSGDRDLLALGTLGHGQCLIYLGRTAEGVDCLDEAMVAVTADEVSPIVAGLIYCAAIETCLRAFDLQRAREWTAALTRWCDAQPDLVPYRGQCQVHRSQMLQMHGAWHDAVDEAQRACERLAGVPAAGDALYQQGELHRLQGELAEAETAYRAAHRAGRDPHPGLALLRLAQGRVADAHAAITRVVGEAVGPVARAAVLGAHVDICLAAGDVAAARTGADELECIAVELDASVVHAMAAQATGAVLLAEGEAREALGPLRSAWTAWHGLDAPYEAARVRVLVGMACRALGDEDTAAMELDAARWVFDELGAAPELVRVAALAGPPVDARARAATDPLTAREAEVLTLVARGEKNRAVAAQLFISDRTVGRHLSNIFAKLGVSSRAAATAWAYEHGLIRSPGGGPG